MDEVAFRFNELVLEMHEYRGVIGREAQRSGTEEHCTERKKEDETGDSLSRLRRYDSHINHMNTIQTIHDYQHPSLNIVSTRATDRPPPLVTCLAAFHFPRVCFPSRHPHPISIRPINQSKTGKIR